MHSASEPNLGSLKGPSELLQKTNVSIPLASSILQGTHHVKKPLHNIGDAILPLFFTVLFLHKIPGQTGDSFWRDVNFTVRLQQNGFNTRPQPCANERDVLVQLSAEVAPTNGVPVRRPMLLRGQRVHCSWKRSGLKKCSGHGAHAFWSLRNCPASHAAATRTHKVKTRRGHVNWKFDGRYLMDGHFALRSAVCRARTNCFWKTMQRSTRCTCCSE